MEEDRLQRARDAIREADREMARCFERRMAAVRDIAACKRERGLPIQDPAQERAVIERGRAWIESEELRGYYEAFIREVMALSRQYQGRLMDGSDPLHRSPGEEKA